MAFIQFLLSLNLNFYTELRMFKQIIRLRTNRVHMHYIIITLPLRLITVENWYSSKNIEECQITLFSETKCSIFFPDISYYNILLITLTRFDPSRDVIRDSYQSNASQNWTSNANTHCKVLLWYQSLMMMIPGGIETCRTDEQDIVM